MNQTEQLIEKLNSAIGQLDIARDCFDQFLNHMVSPEQLAEYSERGHQSVQQSRQYLTDICNELRSAK